MTTAGSGVKGMLDLLDFSERMALLGMLMQMIVLTTVL